jgi:hypothetical protein
VSWQQSLCGGSCRDIYKKQAKTIFGCLSLKDPGDLFVEKE